jgi:hypothetical protein
VKIYEARATLPPDSTQVVGTLRHRLEGEPYTLRLTLYRGDQVLAGNTYDLTYHDPTPAGWREQLVRWAADALLR